MYTSALRCRFAGRADAPVSRRTVRSVSVPPFFARTGVPKVKLPRMVRRKRLAMFRGANARSWSYRPSTIPYIVPSARGNHDARKNIRQSERTP